MNVSPDALRKETVQVLGEIETQLKDIRENATSRGIEAHKLIDTTGMPLMTPLLVAKAQCIHTLALLNEPRKR